jgi:hypothetical protein
MASQPLSSAIKQGESQRFVQEACENDPLDTRE